MTEPEVKEAVGEKIIERSTGIHKVNLYLGEIKKIGGSGYLNIPMHILRELNIQKETFVYFTIFNQVDLPKFDNEQKLFWINKKQPIAKFVESVGQAKKIVKVLQEKK